MASICAWLLPGICTSGAPFHWVDDAAEVARRLSELRVPTDLLHLLVREGVEMGIERKDYDRELISQLLSRLFERYATAQGILELEGLKRMWVREQGEEAPPALSLFEGDGVGAVERRVEQLLHGGLERGARRAVRRLADRARRTAAADSGSGSVGSAGPALSRLASAGEGAGSEAVAALVCT